jgi:2-hydroxy-6-oxonona-2,4-dienedioate hydrolase
VSIPVRPEPEGSYLTAMPGLRVHHHRLGDGPPTLFLHGGGPGSTGWTDFGQVSSLFAESRTCVLIDLVQYGRTDKPAIAGPVWDFHAEAYAGVLDALGFEHADMVCNSWGGSAGLALAARYPARVRRLVVTGSMPVLHLPSGPLPESGARGRLVRDRYYGGTGPSKAKMRALMAALEWYDEKQIPALTVTMRYEQSVTAGERTVAADPTLRGRPQDLSAELGRIACPVLYFWGSHDGFLPPDYALMLAAMTPRADVYVMARASHHPQEERPEDYHRVVSAFLDAEVAA